MIGYGAGAVMFDGGGRVLLVREWHADHQPWVPPGGKIERGETPRQAAERETLEECGVVARAGPLVGVYAFTGDGWLWFVFLADIASGTPAVPPGSEIVDVGWFDPSNLPPECPERVAQLIADAVAGARGTYREIA